MPKKDTGLSGFADVQEEVAKERVAKTHVRTKGAGKVRHSQLRFYDEENWKRAHLFALALVPFHVTQSSAPFIMPLFESRRAHGARSHGPESLKPLPGLDVS
jgi:hypothetical protein